MIGWDGVYANFGSDRVLSNHPRMKTVTVGNEDMGYNASLVTATNDNFTFTNPAPEEFTFGKDMLLIGEMRFQLARNPGDIDDFESACTVWLSAVDRDFTATFRGTGADVNDEAYRAYFAKQMPVGQPRVYASGNTGIEAIPRLNLGNEVRSRYRFPTWTPQPIPLNITIVGANASYSTNGDETAEDHGQFELFNYEYDYVIRDMTPREEQFFVGPSGWLPRMALISS